MANSLFALVIGILAFISVSAEARYASIVVDMDTGLVLHEINADTRNYPASLTKMMTLYMLFEALEEGRLSLDSQLGVSRYAANQVPSKLDLEPGETITVDSAILALVTKSANDVATVIAEALADTEYQFALVMTERAQELGMTRTTFRNASGLPNREQLSTARDMATLAQRLIEDFPQYYPYFSVSEFTYNGRSYDNHNHLLGEYTGTDGIKTGYIRASGFNLAASVKRNGHRLIGVVFGGDTSGSRDRHMVRLLDEAFVQVAALDAEQKKTTVTAGLGATSPDVVATVRRTSQSLDSNATRATSPGVVSEASSILGKPSAALEADIGLQPDATLQESAAAWIVQVGAYRRAQRARRAAEAAQRKLGSVGRALTITIERIDAYRRELYRARLVGLPSETAARSACSDLQRQNCDCFPVAPLHVLPAE